MSDSSRVSGAMALAFVLAGVGHYASAHEEGACPLSQEVIVETPKPVKLRLVGVVSCGVKTCRYEFVGPKDVFVVEVD